MNGANFCKVGPDLINRCYEADRGPFAITIGNTIIAQQAEESYTNDQLLSDHEDRHVDQWAEWGFPGFIGAYTFETIESLITTGDPACGNAFEEEAGFEGTYPHCLPNP